MRHRSALAAAAVAIVVWSGCRAQEAASTPPATPVVTTEPESCTVAPRPLSFLATIAESPPPEQTPVPIEGIPDGVPVDEQTRAEVTATVTMLIACVNAGDVLRAFALYEDTYLARIVDPEQALTVEIANELVVSFATPELVPTDDRTSLVGLPVVRTMADGRVAVVIETNGGVQDDDDESELGLLILARAADGRWLIVDGRTDLSRDELPTA